MIILGYHFRGMKAMVLWLGWAVFFTCLTSCTENINPPEVADQEFFIDENSPAGTIAGVVIAYDMDHGQSVTFRIRKGNNDGIFEIDPNGGHLSVLDPLRLDYELQTQIALSVLVSDEHPRDPMESMAAITVNLNDLNEFAPVMEDQVFEIEESPDKGDLVGIILASDPEAHQGLHFTIVSGNEGQVFALDSETGTLTVEDPAAFDFELNQQFVLSVHVRDIHLDSKSDTAIVTVRITTVQ